MIEIPHIQWFPGHMKKTERMIEKQLHLVDAAIEVVDARIISSSRNPYLSEILGTKPRIIAVNKSDLADPNVNKKWQQSFKNTGTETVFIDCKNGTGVQNIVPAVRNLLVDKINRNKSKGIDKTNIHIMVVGIPNSGKSSLINRLAKKRKANVEDRPGVTREKQWVRISDDCELLDIPGILAPKFDDEKAALNLALTGSIKDSVIDTVTLSAILLETLFDDYKDKIEGRYNISITENDGYEILSQIASKRGFRLRGNELDSERASIVVLDEFRAGKLGRISLEHP
ncbi:MAG: ribosome biogenesis GTPase YlqF [Ruminococcus sp.]|jgi:ribosome biogenesis GTPase A|nr:ribosome biogenesis GTPase YlqF [Ruminococcus sp.]